MIDPTPHLERFDSYEQACREFRWHIPERFNIARAISERHEDAITRVALSDVRPGGINTYTFGGIDFLSDKFANLLIQSGVGQGDAVALILPQSAAFLIAHFGALKLGAVVAPLSTSLPLPTLQRALKECDARVIVGDRNTLDSLSEVVSTRPSFVVESGTRRNRPGGQRKDFWREVNHASSFIMPVETSSSSPAFIFFLPGSEGRLAGVVHSHRSLIGQLAAFEMYNNFSYGSDSAFWTASDWTSPHVLLGMINPALWYGCSIVAQDSISFSVDECFRLIDRCEVTDAFLPSSVINLMRQNENAQRKRGELKLSRVLTAPDSFSQQLYDWSGDSLGAALSVAHGTPETGIIAASCRKWLVGNTGTAGRAAPGHSIEVVDEAGSVKLAGQRGRVALSRFDPALFLNYLNDPEKTDGAFTGDWFVSGGAGYKKEDGDLCVSPSFSKLEGKSVLRKKRD